MFELGKWVQYDDQVSEVISRAVHKRQAGCHFFLDGEMYEIDFDDLIERNLRTNLCRWVRPLGWSSESEGSASDSQKSTRAQHGSPPCESIASSPCIVSSSSESIGIGIASSSDSREFTSHSDSSSESSMNLVDSMSNASSGSDGVVQVFKARGSVGRHFARVAAINRYGLHDIFRRKRLRFKQTAPEYGPPLRVVQ